MGILLREEDVYAMLPVDRQANIDIVYGAYRSVYADKAYLTMPITSGRRLYDVFDRYDVRTVEDLERRRPGALYDEVISPNLASGQEFAQRVLGRALYPLIVPGVFEARRQRWTQDEYMILWLRVITGSVKELYLPDDWAYSSGGVLELTRMTMLQFRLVEGREDRPVIQLLNGGSIGIEHSANELARVVTDLESRGYSAEPQRVALAHLWGIHFYLQHAWRDTYRYHHDGRLYQGDQVVGAARHIGLTRPLLPGLLEMGSDI